ncbi:hypothetical protein K503DRAFT_534875 [Rhizopogon vinicolor AM-OR11-026]|uniref:Uncharacterized protein n=1 Tax=Rhizopogon vinicolor AM-OR11-026 TaxID=1314800 RepID=A0A1B7ML02_9AGAM|nr:hypothetical protein K503DRAFT_534875 [Rhizopogon vinicolor AM-OR11-026]
MRICYSTTDDRSWSYADYPSEPLLPCAAAHRLHEDHSNLTHALTVLKTKVDEGMFEIGQSGELTNRLLLLTAKYMYARKDREISKDSYIRAHCPDDDNYWKAELVDCQKVSVIHFLEHLFGDSFWSQAGDTANELFKHASLIFALGTYGWNDFSRARS